MFGSKYLDCELIEDAIGCPFHSYVVPDPNIRGLDGDNNNKVILLVATFCSLNVIVSVVAVDKHQGGMRASFRVP